MPPPQSGATMKSSVFHDKFATMALLAGLGACVPTESAEARLPRPAASAAAPSSAAAARPPRQPAPFPRPDAAVTRHRTVKLGGVDIFYREAGEPSAPSIVLLHGFPTSSRMYRNLIPALAGRYHVIAPDYPGFGQSGTPDRKHFDYRFSRFADLIDELLVHVGVSRYALYVQDYGAPVGYRLALKHPERVSALVVQNGNAYAEGL